MRHLEGNLQDGEIILYEQFVYHYGLKQQNEIIKDHWSLDQYPNLSSINNLQQF